MPTERRKEQNRLNQRRYRMQIKNRIHLLEQAIATARAATNEELIVSNETSVLDVDDFAGDMRPERLDISVEEIEAIFTNGDNVGLGASSNLDIAPGTLDASNISDLASVDTGLGSDDQTSWLNLISCDTTPGLETIRECPLPARDTDVSSWGSLPNSRSGSLQEQQHIHKRGEENRLQKSNKTSSSESAVIALLEEENKRLKDLNSALLENCSCGGFPHTAFREEWSTNVSQTSMHFDNPSNIVPSQDSPVETSCSTLCSKSASSSDALLPWSPSLTAMQYPTSNHVAGYFDGAYGGNSTQHSGQIVTQPSCSPTNHDPTTTTPYINFPTSAPSPYTSLPLPKSYASLEPSFSRRLLRTIYESGYYILTHTTHFPPSATARIFDFCLSHNTISSIMNKIAQSLGLGSGGVMMVDQLRWGLIPDRRDSGEEVDLMEVGDVEWWLLERGFAVDVDAAMGSIKGKLKQGNVKVKAPVVPYGKVSRTVKLDAWFPERVPHFGTVAMQQNLGENGSLPLHNNGVMAQVPQHTTNVDGQGYQLDMERFFSGLVGRAICLGRTAGFRVADVQEVLDECTIAGK